MYLQIIATHILSQDIVLEECVLKLREAQSSAQITRQTIQQRVLSSTSWRQIMDPKSSSTLGTNLTSRKETSTRYRASMTV